MTQELRSYKPTLRDKIAWIVGDGIAAMGGSNQTVRTWTNKTRNSVDYMPVAGDAATAEDAYRNFEAGNYGRAAIDAGLASIGSIPAGGDVAAGLMKAVVGGVGLKRAPASLAMDEASRLTRAKEMGFHTEMPVYHGSDASFGSFNLSERGSTTGVAPAQTGAAWLTLDPETANEFADLAAKSRGGSPQVYPLLHRAEKPAVLDLDGSEKNLEIAATLDSAFGQGYDSVLLRNYTAPNGKAGVKTLVVRDPEQLRSRFAKFDPAKKLSPDLMAGISLAAPLGLFGMATYQKPKEDGQR